MTNTPTADAFRDAVAFTRCTLREDWDGRTAIALGCDPAAMVDALAMLYIGLIATMVGPNGKRVDDYLDLIREQVPDAFEGIG